MKLPQDPIFIVGYPRSGTTLLQRLLAAQPGFYTFPETHFFCVIEKKIQWAEDKETIPPSALAAIFANMEKKMELRLTGAEQMDLRQQAANKQLTSKALFEYIVGRYLRNLYAEINDTDHFRWIEKTPNHAHFLERITDMYPRAQILHILRHPVPAIYSRKLKFPFNRETPLSELAQRWNRMVGDVECFKANHPDRIMSLRYEDLVRNMAERLQAVADFLQAAFDFKVLDGLKPETMPNAEAFILPSEIWKQADLRLDMRTTNGNYRDLIPAGDVAAIEGIVMENMKRYGYGPFLAGCG